LVVIERSRFVETPYKGEVSLLLARPTDARAMLVLGHGAGSTLSHPFMEGLSESLNASGVATLRFNYPYSERGRGMDSEPVRLATVRAVVARAAEMKGELPLFAGGHSMSGRMTSMAQAHSPLDGVVGVIAFAFPLHSGPPSIKRAAHLANMNVPMLFLSGTRDAMADTKLLEAVVGGLAGATLHWLDTADHGFKPLKRRASVEPVIEEAARVASGWMVSVAALGSRSPPQAG
jgi:predicted alpha/beta-hydrolase family hydrolase